MLLGSIRASQYQCLATWVMVHALVTLYLVPHQQSRANESERIIMSQIHLPKKHTHTNTQPLPSRDPLEPSRFLSISTSLNTHHISDCRLPSYRKPWPPRPISRKLSSTPGDCNLINLELELTLRSINVNDPGLITLVNKLQDVFTTVGVCNGVQNH